VVITALIYSSSQGVFFDRIEIKARGILLSTIPCLLAVIVLLFLNSPFLLVLFALLYGVMDGVMAIGYSVVFAFNFGRVDIGTIDSVAGGVTTFFLGLGPLLFGMSRDFLGTLYDLLFLTRILMYPHLHQGLIIRSSTLSEHVQS